MVLGRRGHFLGLLRRVAKSGRRIAAHLLPVASPPLRVSLLPRLLVPLPGVSVALLLPLFGLLSFLLLLLVVHHLRRFFVLLLDSDPFVINLSILQLTVLSGRSK